VNGLDSLRMTVNLNAIRSQQLSLPDAVAAVVGRDVAHHVVDPEDLLGLDPLRATDLADAFGPLAAREAESWVLVLPTPGSLGSLRGPKELNQTALNVGQAVIGISAGLALVPFRVGQAIQWRLYAAERPFAPPVPYDAERQLNEAVLTAARTLSNLDVAAGSRPRDSAAIDLPAAYSPRQHATAVRAVRLLSACDAALSSDGGAISAYEADIRFRELRSVRAAAAQALCAAASWVEVD
jgi:hypothetical protein